MKPFLGLGLFLLLLLGLTYCRQDTALTYLPSKSQLRNGIYNKYYLHYQPADSSREGSIDIAYIGYECRNDQQELKLTYYDPAYDPTRVQLIRCDDEAWELLKEAHYFQNGDTVEARFTGNTLFRLQADSSTSTFEMSYPNEVHFEEFIEHQEGRDTIIDNRPGWVAVSKGYRLISYPEDTVKTDWKREQILVEGIGLYSRSLQTEDYSYSWELMEQMPHSAFHRLERERPKRVGYINPQEALEGAGDFQTCGSTDQIADYYNGDPDGGPAGDKPALEKAVEAHWKPALFTGLNGYLTLRFVINCQGEAGRFTLESSNLDFQATTFPTAAVTHCMEILQSIKNWTPAHIRGEDRDAYAYITFKLKDGELVQLLP